MTWTTEMNEYVMRCYYRATELETIKRGYAPTLYRLFKEKYPDVTHITEQRPKTSY